MILIFIVIVVLTLVYKINKHKIKGAIGELSVRNKLKKLPINEYKVFNNVLLKTSIGSSQIDHVVVSMYGIYVIEAKHFKGWIHGHEKSQNWTQTIYKKKVKFRNPIKQNWSHIYALKEVLSDFKNVRYHNIVVFTGGGKLKNITSNTPVIYRRQLIRTIKSTKESINLHVEQVNAITVILNQAVVSNKTTKSEHVKQVKRSRKEYKQKIEQLICPRCDCDLLVRKGKYGKFYGCSNYPQCKFVMPYKR